MVDDIHTVEPTMLHSPDISDLATALSKAQESFPPIRKTHTADVRSKTGASYRYNYADLADVLEMVRPSLAKHELAVLQPITKVAGEGRIITLLVHSSGQWIRSEYSLRLTADVPDTPQAWGSAITYGRRYSLCSILGVAAEEDDDGSAATDPGDTKRTPRKRPPPKANGTPAKRPTLTNAIKQAEAAADFSGLRTVGQSIAAWPSGPDKNAVADTIRTCADAILLMRLDGATTAEEVDAILTEATGDYDGLFPGEEKQAQVREQAAFAKQRLASMAATT